MAYQLLGARQKTAAADPLNPFGAGFWTATFTPTDFTVTVPLFEVYHAYVDGPNGATMKIFIGSYPWDNVPQASQNGWDPSQPMPLRPGDVVYFKFNTAATPAPVVTLWLRH